MSISERRALIDLLAKVQARPEMFGLRRTYESAASFFLGIDAAHGFVLFKPLTEWIVDKYELHRSARNLAWFCHAAKHACPERWDKPAERTSDDESAIFREVFTRVVEYLPEAGSDRETPAGR